MRVEDAPNYIALRLQTLREIHQKTTAPHSIFPISQRIISMVGEGLRAFAQEFADYHGGDVIMFGQPNWFRAKKFGWGLVPITWQGWAYTGAWVTALVVPFWGLLAQDQPHVPEALTWLACGIGLLCLDVRSILKAMNPTVATASVVRSAPKDDGILYILDDSPAQLATRNYNLQLRR